MRKIKSLIALATAVLMVAACSSTGPATEKRTSIILGRAMDVTTLDISRSLCDTCQIYNSAVYETLLKVNPTDHSLEPLLATSWKANADNTVFTFTLRDGIKFADGTPVEAKDVQWSWERLQNLAGSPSYFMTGIKSVAAPDAKTVVVTSAAPNSAFFNIVTASYMGVINSDVATQNGATDDKDAAKTDKAEQWFMKNSAGSGQYELSSYAEGSQLVLKSNPNYWGTKPNFTEVTIKQVADSSAQLQQLQQGDIDVAMQLSFDDLDQIKADSKITSQVLPSYNFVYVGLSPGVAGGEALKNAKVRDAFRKAIDYKSVIGATVAGNGVTQSTGIPNGFEGADGLPLPTYDAAGAKAELAAAGYPNGLTLDATYPTFTIYGVNFNTMFQSIQQSLKTAGITLKLHPLEYTAWANQFGTKGAPVTAIYFAPDHPDTIQYVQYFGLVDGSSWLASSKMAVNAQENTLAAKALTETGSARTATYAQIGQQMYDDAIILPVVNPKYLLASSSDVQGNNYDITRNLDLSRLSFK